MNVLTIEDIEAIEILQQDAMRLNCKETYALLVEEQMPRLIADAKRLRNEMNLIANLSRQAAQ